MSLFNILSKIKFNIKFFLLKNKIKDMNNNITSDNLDILDIRNISVLTDIFNKHFDPDKHVPILYLVLQTDTLKNTGLIDVKLLMLEVEKPVDKNKK